MTENKRERVIASAMKEYARVPLEQVSVKHIVEEAGIPRGSFYQYFDGKEDLCVYLLQRVKSFLDGKFDRLERRDAETIFDLISLQVSKDINLISVLEENEPEAAFLKNISQSQTGSSLFNSYLNSVYSQDEYIMSLMRDPKLGVKDELELRALLELLFATGKKAIFSVLEGEMAKEDAIRLLRAKLAILKRSFVQ